MNKILIEPHLVFITKEDWYKEGFSDLYLEKMIDTFHEIDSEENLKVIWSFRLEELLWTDSKYRPWSELNTKNSLVPVLYKFFRNNTEYFEHSNLLASSYPKLEKSDLNITHEYYCLTNDLILKDEHFAYFGEDNPILFKSNCGKNYYPYPCKTRFDISALNFNTKFKTLETLDKKKQYLSDLINSYLKAKEMNAVNSFKFNSSFIKRVVELKYVDLCELIEKLSLRLSYNMGESRCCPILQDEFITAHGINEYRIRISPRPSSKRVHYIFDSNVIEFISYYGTGEHDDGL